MFNLVTSKLSQGKNQLLSRTQKDDNRETTRGTMLLSSRDEMDQPMGANLDDLDEFDQMMREQTGVSEDPAAEEN